MLVFKYDDMNRDEWNRLLFRRNRATTSLIFNLTIFFFANFSELFQLGPPVHRLPQVFLSSNPYPDVMVVFLFRI